MPSDHWIPLDLDRTTYSYVERPNTVLLSLIESWVASESVAPRILDIGCGAGANARALRAAYPGSVLVGIEPNAGAAEQARDACDEVFTGTLQDWLARQSDPSFDCVILADVLEHIADPVAFLRALAAARPLATARFVISVPNYAVWYNRVRTLYGRFDYGWSGLYDRTHLRFFTRRSIAHVLGYCGFRVLADACTPSIAQSAAPVLRRWFESDVRAGDHLSLNESGAFRAYRRYVEPIELGLCRLWPELLGFQIVCVAEVRRRAAAADR